MGTSKNLQMKLKKRLRSKARLLQYIGLGLLAVATAFVVALTMFRAPEPVQANDVPAPVQVTPTATAKAGVKVAFIGDSYTSGVGATSLGTRWTTRLSSSLGWEEVNLGQGGSGFTGGGGVDPATGKERPSYPEMIPEAVAAKPNVVVVATAGNDFNRGPEAFQPAITDFFTTLRAGLPNAKIIVVSTFWRGPGEHEHLAVLNESLAAGAESVGGRYLDIGDDFQNSLAEGLLGSDEIHPNDVGHAYLAAAVEKAYTASPAAAR